MSMPKRILVLGLPGSGKTTLAKQLVNRLQTEHNKSVVWFNADEVRKQFDDWDFSYEGRLRQATRMRNLCDQKSEEYNFAIVDFVCPLPEMRDIFDADYTIWMDTILQGRYQDTNKMFVPPKKYDMCVNSKDAPYFTSRVVNELLMRKQENDEYRKAV